MKIKVVVFEVNLGSVPANPMATEVEPGRGPRLEIDDATEKQRRERLDDEDFKKWAKKNMRIPSDNARRAYDRQQVDGVWASMKNWMRGVKLRHAEHTEVPEDVRMSAEGGIQADLPRFDAEKAGITAKARIKTAQMRKAASGLIGKKMTVGGKEASMEKDDASEYAWSGYSRFLHVLARRSINWYAKKEKSLSPLAEPERGSSTTVDSISKTDSIVNGGSAWNYPSFYTPC